MSWFSFSEIFSRFSSIEIYAAPPPPPPPQPALQPDARPVMGPPAPDLQAQLEAMRRSAEEAARLEAEKAARLALERQEQVNREEVQRLADEAALKAAEDKMRQEAERLQLDKTTTDQMVNEARGIADKETAPIVDREIVRHDTQVESTTAEKNFEGVAIKEAQLPQPPDAAPGAPPAPPSQEMQNAYAAMLLAHQAELRSAAVIAQMTGQDPNAAIDAQAQLIKQRMGSGKLTQEGIDQHVGEMTGAAKKESPESRVLQQTQDVESTKDEKTLDDSAKEVASTRSAAEAAEKLASSSPATTNLELKQNATALRAKADEASRKHDRLGAELNLKLAERNQGIWAQEVKDAEKSGDQLWKSRAKTNLLGAEEFRHQMQLIKDVVDRQTGFEESAIDYKKAYEKYDASLCRPPANSDPNSLTKPEFDADGKLQQNDHIVRENGKYYYSSEGFAFLANPRIELSSEASALWEAADKKSEIWIKLNGEDGKSGAQQRLDEYKKTSPDTRIIPIVPASPPAPLAAAPGQPGTGQPELPTFVEPSDAENASLVTSSQQLPAKEAELNEARKPGSGKTPDEVKKLEFEWFELTRDTAVLKLDVVARAKVQEHVGEVQKLTQLRDSGAAPNEVQTQQDRVDAHRSEVNKAVNAANQERQKRSGEVWIRKDPAVAGVAPRGVLPTDAMPTASPELRAEDRKTLTAKLDAEREQAVALQEQTAGGPLPATTQTVNMGAMGSSSYSVPGMTARVYAAGSTEPLHKRMEFEQKLGPAQPDAAKRESDHKEFSADPAAKGQQPINDFVAKYAQPLRINGTTHLKNTLGVALGYGGPNEGPATEFKEDLFRYLPKGQGELLDKMVKKVVEESGNDNPLITLLPVYYSSKETGLVSTILVKITNEGGKERFIDDRGWSYESIQDYRNNNKLPPGETKLAIPKDGKIQRDDKNNVILFTGPARDERWDEEWRREHPWIDPVIGGLGLVAGVVVTIGTGGLAAPVVGAGWAMLGATGTYFALTSGHNLYTQATHGQSLNPIENADVRMDYLTLAASAMPVGASGARSTGQFALAARWARTATTLEKTAQVMGEGARVLGYVQVGAQAHSLGTNWENMSGTERGYALGGLLMGGAGILTPHAGFVKRLREPPVEPVVSPGKAPGEGLPVIDMVQGEDGVFRRSGATTSPPGAEPGRGAQPRSTSHPLDAFRETPEPLALGSGAGKPALDGSVKPPVVGNDGLPPITVNPGSKEPGAPRGSGTGSHPDVPPGHGQPTVAPTNNSGSSAVPKPASGAKGPPTDALPVRVPERVQPVAAPLIDPLLQTRSFPALSDTAGPTSAVVDADPLTASPAKKNRAEVQAARNRSESTQKEDVVKTDKAIASRKESQGLNTRARQQSNADLRSTARAADLNYLQDGQVTVNGRTVDVQNLRLPADEHAFVVVADETNLPDLPKLVRDMQAQGHIAGQEVVLYVCRGGELTSPGSPLRDSFATSLSNELGVRVHAARGDITLGRTIDVQKPVVARPNLPMADAAHAPQRRYWLTKDGHGPRVNEPFGETARGRGAWIGNEVVDPLHLGRGLTFQEALKVGFSDSHHHATTDRYQGYNTLSNPSNQAFVEFLRALGPETKLLVQQIPQALNKGCCPTQPYYLLRSPSGSLSPVPVELLPGGLVRARETHVFEGGARIPQGVYRAHDLGLEGVRGADFPTTGSREVLVNYVADATTPLEGSARMRDYIDHFAAIFRQTPPELAQQVYLGITSVSPRLAGGAAELINVMAYMRQAHPDVNFQVAGLGEINFFNKEAVESLVSLSGQHGPHTMENAASFLHMLNEQLRGSMVVVHMDIGRPIEMNVEGRHLLVHGEVEYQNHQKMIDMANKYPNVQFVWAHAGGLSRSGYPGSYGTGGHTEMLRDVLTQTRNVKIDMSWSTVAEKVVRDNHRTHDWVGGKGKGIMNEFQNRFVYGSDSIGQDLKSYSAPLLAYFDGGIIPNLVAPEQFLRYTAAALMEGGARAFHAYMRTNARMLENHPLTGVWDMDAPPQQSASKLWVPGGPPEKPSPTRAEALSTPTEVSAATKSWELPRQQVGDQATQNVLHEVHRAGGRLEGARYVATPAQPHGDTGLASVDTFGSLAEAMEAVDSGAVPAASEVLVVSDASVQTGQAVPQEGLLAKVRLDVAQGRAAFDRLEFNAGYRGPLKIALPEGYRSDAPLIRVENGQPVDVLNGGRINLFQRRLPDLQIFGEGDGLRVDKRLVAEAVPVPEGYFAVSADGRAGGLRDADGQVLDGPAVARRIQSHANYQPGQPVFIYACDGGAGVVALAQEVATALRVDVYAGNAPMRVDSQVVSDGSVAYTHRISFESDPAANAPDGQFRRFRPGLPIAEVYENGALVHEASAEALAQPWRLPRPEQAGVDPQLLPSAWPPTAGGAGGGHSTLRMANAPHDFSVPGTQWPELLQEIRSGRLTLDGELNVYLFQRGTAVDTAAAQDWQASNQLKGWVHTPEGSNKPRWLGQSHPDKSHGTRASAPRKQGGLGEGPRGSQDYFVVSRKPPREVLADGGFEGVPWAPSDLSGLALRTEPAPATAAIATTDDAGRAGGAPPAGAPPDGADALPPAAGGASGRRARGVSFAGAGGSVLATGGWATLMGHMPGTFTDPTLSGPVAFIYRGLMAAGRTQLAQSINTHIDEVATGQGAGGHLDALEKKLVKRGGLIGIPKPDRAVFLNAINDLRQDAGNTVALDALRTAPRKILSTQTIAGRVNASLQIGTLGVNTGNTVSWFITHGFEPGNPATYSNAILGTANIALNSVNIAERIAPLAKLHDYANLTAIRLTRTGVMGGYATGSVPWAIKDSFPDDPSAPIGLRATKAVLDLGFGYGAARQGINDVRAVRGKPALPSRVAPLVILGGAVVARLGIELVNSILAHKDSKQSDTPAKTTSTTPVGTANGTGPTTTSTTIATAPPTDGASDISPQAPPEAPFVATEPPKPEPLFAIVSDADRSTATLWGIAEANADHLLSAQAASEARSRGGEVSVVAQALQQLVQINPQYGLNLSLMDGRLSNQPGDPDVVLNGWRFQVNDTAAAAG